MCSPGWIRTSNLLLTELLLLPRGLDYLITPPGRGRVYSLYTFILRLRSGRVLRRNLARDSPQKKESPELARFFSPHYCGKLPIINRMPRYHCATGECKGTTHYTMAIG